MKPFGVRSGRIEELMVSLFPKDVAVECVKVVTEATVAQPKEYPSAGKYVVSCVTKKNKNRMIGSLASRRTQ